MSHARVAILLSVYNGENYLAEQLESILHQSFQHIAHLIVGHRPRIEFHARTAAVFHDEIEM